MRKHWTSDSTKDFLFSVAVDFTAEIHKYMEQHDISQKDLATKLGVSESRVSQVFKNPSKK